jgi:hypothetical protein
MPSIKVNMTVEVDEQILLDTLTTAVESGGHALWYWEGFNMVNVDRDGDLNVDQITFDVDHPEDGKRYTVNMEDVREAIETILSDQRSMNIDGSIVTSIRESVLGNDFDMDALGADVVVQVAAFGEVIFG